MICNDPLQIIALSIQFIIMHLCLFYTVPRDLSQPVKASYAVAEM